MPRRLPRVLAASLLSAASAVSAQSASLLHAANGQQPGVPYIPPTSVEDVSLIMLPAPPTYQLHDLIHIKVNETIVNRVNAQVNKRRNVKFDYSLEDFIMILSNLRLRADETIRDQKPGIDLQAQNSEQKQYQFNRNDIIKYALQAEVVEIRPNGNLVLEANGEVSVNNEVYQYRLSGVVNPLDVNPTQRVIDSDHVASKRLDLRVVGAARDSLKRGYITSLMDWFQPF